MKKLNILKVAVICLPLLTSCASKKTMLIGNGTTGETVAAEKQVESTHSESVKALSFVQKVADNQVYTQNITGSISFNLQAGSKDITVPGSLKMRKDQVIRIQLNIPLLGTEVGRLEFTPDYVLIIDRIHKEYIKADYNQVDFLKKQGITFYSLQALFWNQLLLPGVQKVSESDLKKFDVDLSGTTPTVPVSYKDGNMLYEWMAERVSGRITEARVSYNSSQYGKSSLNLQYSEFKNVGVKQFPATQNLTLTTTATKKVQEVKINIEMNEVKTDSKWDAYTEVSSKYKQVNPEDVLKKIMSL